MMQRKARCWTLMLMVIGATVVLSSPKEKSASADRGEPDVITNSIGMKLVRIPAGEFMIGAEEDQDATMTAFPSADPALLPRESPRHKIRITKPFYMGQYEVTLGQFMTFLREADYKIDAERDGKPMTGYGKNGETIESTAFRPWAPGWKVEPDHPAGYVSWNDAIAFCDWLSRKEGKKYRLPTEAEWEYACRAGTSSRYYCGNNPEELIGFANVADADRAAEIPGKPVDTFDKSGKKTGKQIPYPFLSGHDGYAWTAPVGRFRPMILVSTTCTAIPGNGAPIGSARITTANRLLRIHMVRQVARRASLAEAHSTILPLRCGARAATAARRSRVTAMTVSALCLSSSRKSKIGGISP